MVVLSNGFWLWGKPRDILYRLSLLKENYLYVREVIVANTH